MGFATALSGLKAASTNLQVTGNNIANSQTVGFKESRAEFADVYASSFGGVSRTQPGSGVKVTEVAQQFKDGNIDPTQNSLDLALSGNGFFVLADEVNLPDPANPTAPVDPSVPSAYTRNGAFKLDSSGNVINSQGKYLLAFAANGTTVDEGFSVGVFRPLTIDTSQGLPNATENIDLALTLNSGANLPTVSTFDPTDAKSYTHTTSVTTYDSQGNAHIASTYYVKTPVANVWDAYLFMDDYGITTGGQAVPPAAAPPSTVSATVNTPGLPTKMSFTSSGLLSEVGTRAAAISSAATLTAANTTVTDTTAASTAAATAGAGAGSLVWALSTDTGPVAAAAAVTAAQAASASATAFAAAAAAANSTPSAAALAADLKTKADAAKIAAAAYATAAAGVNSDATADAAAILATAAATAAATAQAAAVAYNTAVAAAANGATPQTKVDFGTIDLSSIDPTISVDPMAFDVDFAETAQTSASFSVNNSSQDGLPAGNLTGIDVDGTGVVFARYSNGGSKTLGQVALARFQSNQSLAKLGDTSWAKTSTSGAPVYGAAGDNNFGDIQSSALESSTVDLSEQLVKLIVAQQAYQANSQTITTEKTLVETILRA